MLLSEEGVQFDDHGRANPGQTRPSEELAQLAGVATDDAPALLDRSLGQGEFLRDSFVEQLGGAQKPGTVRGVLTLFVAWCAMGGHVRYGWAGEMLCVLMAREADDRRGPIWPLALYATGRCEVVFQYLATRVPYDDPRLREELRTRFNAAPGVDLPAAKLELKPGFDIAMLADGTTRDPVIATLGWFLETSRATAHE